MPGKPTKFVEEPSALLCPVCKKVFIEPVISIKWDGRQKGSRMSSTCWP